ncbi:MAG TPA: SMI1/KNR4 family protein [Thermoguttaceae bacterium]|nr:SMI1/KNR4 family protein [Thermoguttaceae bacterium]
MTRYDQLRELIEANPDIAEFADFGNGVSNEWIERAESALGFRLPETYKWWLRNFSGGEVGGEEIYSIYGEDFDSVVGGDIVYMYRQQRQPGLRVPICHSDIDGVFFFDRGQASADGEYPIFSEATGKIYAHDFLEFLRKRIEAFLPGGKP